MNNVAAILVIVVSSLVGFLLGKKKGGDDAGGGNADATFFQTSPGSDGFVNARVLKAHMKGRTFYWNRVGIRPAQGSRFEIRPKSGTSVLLPPIPTGVDTMAAEAGSSVPPGTIYKYALWQVLSDGRAKNLHDPELEIGQI